MYFFLIRIVIINSLQSYLVNGINFIIYCSFEFEFRFSRLNEFEFCFSQSMNLNFEIKKHLNGSNRSCDTMSRF